MPREKIRSCDHTTSNDKTVIWAGWGQRDGVTYPHTQKSTKLISMRKLTATICLTFAVLLGSVGMSASADYQKDLTAYKSGDYATFCNTEGGDD